MAQWVLGKVPRWTASSGHVGPLWLCLYELASGFGKPAASGAGGGVAL
jgi:hypothetical protein